MQKSALDGFYAALRNNQDVEPAHINVTDCVAFDALLDDLNTPRIHSCTTCSEQSVKQSYRCRPRQGERHAAGLRDGAWNSSS